jgi:hypothetical protein
VRVQIGIFILCACHLAWASSGSGVEITSPEFECTVIGIKDSSRASKIFGKHDYPTVSLRVFSSGQWQFHINERTLSLSRESVSKTAGYATRTTSYVIHFDEIMLRFDLVGMPPSRQGEAWEAKRPPLQSNMIARLTCH